MKKNTKHAGGRPPKFATPEELQDIPNQDVKATSDSAISNNDFDREIDLQNFIVNNIQAFCKDILEDDLISFEVEYNVTKQMYFSPRPQRVDLFIKCKRKVYIVELKNPKCLAENRYAIGQLLDYGREFLDSKKELILITTKFDFNTAKTIKHYNLPIRYIYFERLRALEFKRVENG